MPLTFNKLGAALAVVAFALAAPAANAQSGGENGLLGVKLMGSFREVLAKYGAPFKIQAGEPTDPTADDMSSRPGGAGGLGRPGGMAGGGGLAGGLGGPGGIGRPSGGRGRGGLAGGLSGGLPGFAGGVGGPRGGLAGGLAGGGPAPAPGGAGGLPGFGGGPNANDAQLQGAENGGGIVGGGPREPVNPDETTWWFKRGQLYYSFLFDHEGKVIQIAEFGRSGGSPSHRGIALGSPFGKIVQHYGFTDDGSPNGEDLTLRYGDRDQIMFQLVNNRVVGITIGIAR